MKENKHKNTKLISLVLVILIFISSFSSFAVISKHNYTESNDSNETTISYNSEIQKTNDCRCAKSFELEENENIQNKNTIDINELKQRKINEKWTFDISDKSEILDQPIEMLCGLKIPENLDQNYVGDNNTDSNPKNLDLPDSFDWRDHGIGLPPVRNQGSCGSCWAFGTLSPLECNIWLTDREEVDLSEQWLLSCNSDGYGCDGGWWAHGYLKENGKSDPCGDSGAVLESDFPYTAREDNCGCPYEHKYFIENAAYIDGTNSEDSIEEIKQAIYEYGPVSAAVYVSNEFQAYSEGVFNSDYNSQCNHAITLIGWDDNQGSNGVWFLRNSWGPSWGEGGYMRIEYSCSKVGYAATYVDYKGGVSLIDLEYSPGLYDFGDMYKDESGSTTFEIWNDGEEDMDYSLSEDCDWVSILPKEGISSSGEKDTINVEIDTAGLDYGLNTCSINIDSNGGNGVFEVKVDVMSHPPDEPTNINPSDGVSGVSVDPTVLSVGVSDVDDDPLSVSFFDESDDSLIDSVENVESGETVTVEWDDLDFDTSYSWYVVVNDSVIESESNVFSFTTNSPPVFSNIFPVNGSLDISSGIDNLSLDISDPEGDNFDWSISTISNVGSNYVSDDVDGTKFCSVDGLTPDTEYVWTVTAVDSKGAESESVFSFKTRENMPPSGPIAVSPNADASDVSIVCTLNWSCMDPDGDKGLIYDVYFGENSDPSLLESDVIDSSFDISFDLDLDTTYYWKIIAEDSFGATSESSVFIFKTSPVPPPPDIGSIDISFPKKFCRAGVKASILNIGSRDASNVFWHVSVNGGLFNRVNMSENGCINRLNSTEMEEISTYDFLDFKSRPFGIGRVKATLVTSNVHGEVVGRESKDGFLLGSFLLFLK